MKNQPTNGGGAPVPANSGKFVKQQVPGGNMFYPMPNNPQGQDRYTLEAQGYPQQ
jgi:hypothetical protein